MARQIVTDQFTEEELSAKIAQIPNILKIAEEQTFGALTIALFIADGLNCCGHSAAFQDRFIEALLPKLTKLGIDYDYVLAHLTALQPDIRNRLCRRTPLNSKTDEPTLTLA